MRLAVSLGDPAGIGPEVTEAAAQVVLREIPSLELVLVGPGNLATPMQRRLGSRVRCETQDGFFGEPGTASKESGRAALSALMHAIALAKSGHVHGIVTAPISKHALALAGSSDRGHTEILARELGRGPTAMAFFTDQLRVVLATTHIPFRQVADALTPERVVEVSRLLYVALRDQLGVAAPRLGLCGLNPHAGEDGLLGNDETAVLQPAVAMARMQGVALQGPFPADTLFHRANAGEFDGVVALYHDQGLIPVKLLSFGQAVNVTLGLSVVRTSPDHGTAFDIAGKGVAKPDGMLGAFRTAVTLVLRRSHGAALSE